MNMKLKLKMKMRTLSPVSVFVAVSHLYLRPPPLLPLSIAGFCYENAGHAGSMCKTGWLVQPSASFGYPGGLAVGSSLGQGREGDVGAVAAGWLAGVPVVAESSWSPTVESIYRV